MANPHITLTASNIKYLLVLKELNQTDGGVRCASIAEALGVSRPSVHRMIDTLKELGLVQKSRYGMVFFTRQGQVLAEQYSIYYCIVCRYFAAVLLEETDKKAAAFALLAEIPLDSIAAMCSCMEVEMQRRTETGSALSSIRLSPNA